MRTQDEIVGRVNKVKEYDMFGFETSELIVYLDFEHAKPFLKDDVTAEQWQVSTKTPREEMIEYMPFAWEKANNERGISAMRSLMHYAAWLWLDGNDVLAEKIGDYEYYGKPQLIAICKYLGLDPNKWDDGRRVNS